MLAQDLIAKYAAHLPLYHQERVFGRQGLTIAGSALVQWEVDCDVQLRPPVDAWSMACCRNVALIQSAKLDGNGLHAYLKDALSRVLTQKNRAIDEQLEHNWQRQPTCGGRSAYAPPTLSHS